MAVLNLTAIRQGLANTITQGVPREMHGYPYPKGGNEELPCVIVHTADEYVDWYGSIAAADDGLCVLSFVLEFMASSRTTIEDGLRVLDEVVSAAVDAIESDRSLGGTVDDTLVGVSSGQSGIQLEDGRPQAVRCSTPLTVWKQRS